LIVKFDAERDERKDERKEDENEMYKKENIRTLDKARLRTTRTTR
jgi:hypothetical protein